MCGRFGQFLNPQKMRELYRAEPTAPLEPRYNGAPTQTFATCRVVGRKREIALLRWGLVPPWADSTGTAARLINARAETVDSRPAFRSAYRRRRCLVPANGWFEWSADKDFGKRPWWIAPIDGQPCSLAGIWERWEKAGERLETFAILTCPACQALAAIHARQPVVVPPDRHTAWLDDDVDEPMPQALLCSPHTGPYRWLPAPREVGNPRNDYPELIPER